MHNLAVLYAEGIDGKPDYDVAVKWFRKAAQRGIADSQYNLGVLAARGLGTDKNFAESYKWFALAAASGDTESAKKRDEVAGHLTPRRSPPPSRRSKASCPAAAGRGDRRAQAAWRLGRRQRRRHRGRPGACQAEDDLRPAPHAPLSLGSFTVGKR